MNPVKWFGAAAAKDWQRPSVIALLLANLVPVFGVVVLGWEVFPLMFLFWSENVIVGVFNVLKMLFANPGSKVTWGGKLFVILFFCVHYGMFTLVHGVFVVSLFGGGMKAGTHFSDGLNLDRMVHDYHLGWAILSLAVSHGFSFITNYIGHDEYKRASVRALMGQPYGRVVVLHITILFGGLLMRALDSPTAGLLVLVGLKVALDLGAHLAERKKFRATPELKDV